MLNKLYIPLHKTSIKYLRQISNGTEKVIEVKWLAMWEITREKHMTPTSKTLMKTKVRVETVFFFDFPNFPWLFGIKTYHFQEIGWNEIWLSDSHSYFTVIMFFDFFIMIQERYWSKQTGYFSRSISWLLSFFLSTLFHWLLQNQNNFLGFTDLYEPRSWGQFRKTGSNTMQNWTKY